MRRLHRTLYAALCMKCVLGSSQITFQNPITTPVQGIPTSVVAADFNHDGKLDVAVSSVDYTGLFSQKAILQVFLGNGDGTFRPPVSYSAPCAIFPMVAGQFFRNGDLDLALVCNTVAVFRGVGDGTFSGPVSSAPSMRSLGSFSVGVADLNGDGNMDLAIPGGNPNIPKFGVGGIYVLLGNGDGTFQPPLQIGADEVEALVTVDCNLDGYPDIITSDSSAK